MQSNMSKREVRNDESSDGKPDLDQYATNDGSVEESESSELTVCY